MKVSSKNTDVNINQISLSSSNISEKLGMKHSTLKEYIIKKQN